MPATSTATDDPVSLVVSDRRTEGRDVAVIDLRRADRGELPEWTAGAHVSLRLGSDDLTREYSLCGSPSDRSTWRIAVRRTERGRGGSDYVHSRLGLGESVEAVRMANLFTFDPVARPYFVAAGIGITPILPMIERAEEAGADWRLLYLGRTRESMPFLDQLAEYGERVSVVESSTDGRVDPTALVRDNAGAHFYACGPEALLDDLEKAVRASEGTRLSVERFTPRGPADDSEDTPFSVVLASSGRTVPVGPDQSVLTALLDAGVRVRNSCGEGTCGSCEVVVLDGVPDHRDSILTDEERAHGDCMYVCVSRSRTPTLTVDL